MIGEAPVQKLAVARERRAKQLERVYGELQTRILLSAAIPPCRWGMTEETLILPRLSYALRGRPRTEAG
jgi:hypothetical protein